MTRQEMIAAVEGELKRLDQIRALLVKSHSERFTFPTAGPSMASGLQKRILGPKAVSVAPDQKRPWEKPKHVSPDVN